MAYDLDKITLIPDRILVEESKPPERVGSLYTPHNLYSRDVWGHDIRPHKVLKVSPDITFCKPGDTIYFQGILAISDPAFPKGVVMLPYVKEQAVMVEEG